VSLTLITRVLFFDSFMILCLVAKEREDYYAFQILYIVILIFFFLIIILCLLQCLRSLILLEFPK
jgi:hypothetical protein